MTDILIGKTYTVVPPEPDPTCDTRGCELHQPDLVSPWFPFFGKRVTVTETGLIYNNCHPAVRVTYGPIDWHPRVMVTLTDEQVRALGVEPNIASAYLISGYVIAVDSSDAPIGGTAWPDEFTFDFTYQSPVEMPRQRTAVLPTACLSDGSMSPDERRRENRLRRTAGRQGLKLKKMRGFLPARSAGPYWLQNAIGTAVAGQPWSRRGLSLDEIEAALRQRQNADAPSPGAV